MNQLSEINEATGLNIPLEKWEPLTDEMKTCLQNIATKGYLCVEDYYFFRDNFVKGKNYKTIGWYGFVFGLQNPIKEIKPKLEAGKITSKEFLTKIFGL